MPKVLSLLLFAEYILGFHFSQDITHTSPIIPIIALAETYGKSEEQDSTEKSQKKEQSQPRLALTINPEFTQNGILGARIFAKDSC